jgi:esterase/lipase superfamily enzyme
MATILLLAVVGLFVGAASFFIVRRRRSRTSHAPGSPAESHQESPLSPAEMIGRFDEEWLDRLVEKLEAYGELDSLTVHEASTGPEVEELPRVGVATDASDPPSVPAELVRFSRGSHYSVWYATNRRPHVRKGGVRYGARIDREIHRGVCTLWIPKKRAMGSIGSKWWLRLVSGDDRIKVKQVTPLGEEFWPALRAFAEGFDPARRHALVFIHGYRVSFQDAVIRAAQLGVDLDIPGPVSVFSWPSRASLLGYTADGSAVEASENAITDYLVDFATLSGVDRVNVIAHSMGNRPLMRALQRILGMAQARTQVQFANLVLAAPDITRELFLDLAPQYARLSRRTTLYVSELDRALKASYRLQGPRVGLVPPVTCCPGIDTVQVAHVDRTFMGHSTFAEARPLLYDIQALFTNELPPERRPGLAACVDAEGQRYWEVRR